EDRARLETPRQHERIVFAKAKIGPSFGNQAGARRTAQKVEKGFDIGGRIPALSRVDTAVAPIIDDAGIKARGLEVAGTEDVIETGYFEACAPLEGQLIREEPAQSNPATRRGFSILRIDGSLGCHRGHKIHIGMVEA